MTHQEDSSVNEGHLDTGGIETPEGEERSYDVVYLEEEGVLGMILMHGAHFSTVYYVLDGIAFEVDYANEDLEKM